LDVIEMFLTSRWTPKKDTC